MATTLALRRRIKTAQNVSKTTRAMQMIAASKLKRAQEAALASRPYVKKITELSKNITVQSGNMIREELHPYMRMQQISGQTLYIIISPDKGLCGGLITNLIREYLQFKNQHALFITVGKKIESAVASTGKNLIASFPFGTTLPQYEMIFPLKDLIDEYFIENEKNPAENKRVDSVQIITTHFESVFSQKPRVTQLLPVTLEILVEKNTMQKDRIFEPGQKQLLPQLLQRYVEMSLYQHLLESYASEQAARMLAMQNATNNAKDIVATVKLLYNKARQEKITKEILDISSASVALEGE